MHACAGVWRFEGLGNFLHATRMRKGLRGVTRCPICCYWHRPKGALHGSVAKGLKRCLSLDSHKLDHQ